MDELDTKIRALDTLEDYIEFLGEKWGKILWDKHLRRLLKLSDKDIHMITEGDHF